MLVTIIIAVILIYLVITYNSLVNIRENVHKAWANIDVLLKQRHDELPKLVDVCKQYMLHEQQTLEKVMQARSVVDAARQQQNAGALSTAESVLQSHLGGMYAVVENYPELKANQHFHALQHRITGLENAIADRREFYNDSVNINNVRIQQFPDVIVARLFGFAPQTLLRFAAAELADVDIDARFNR